MEDEWDALEGPRSEPQRGPARCRGVSAGIRRHYFIDLAQDRLLEAEGVGGIGPAAI
jgi:hypothetical protein